MARKYCVFWIPTIFHIQQKHIATSTSNNISDIESCPFLVTVTLESSGNVIITPNKKEDHKVCLNFVESSRNGLFLYYYENKNSDTDNEQDENFISEHIPNAIYHLVKGFYHIHEHHDAEEDSLLKAFLSDKPVKIKEPNNEALCHYLHEYEKKFKAYSKQISVSFLHLQQKSLDWRNIYGLFTRGSRAISKICQQALGEYVYCNSLLQSKYNEQTDLVGNTTIDKQIDKVRIMVFNIKNAVRNIELLNAKNQTYFNYKNTRVSVWIAFIGIIIAILGIVLTVKSFQEPDYVKTVLDKQENIIRILSTN